MLEMILLSLAIVLDMVLRDKKRTMQDKGDRRMGRDGGRRIND